MAQQERERVPRQRSRRAPARRARPARPQRVSAAALARARGLRRRWIAVLTVLTIAGLTYVLFFTSFLGVSSVEVSGTSTISSDEIRAAAAVPEQVPMLRVDTDEIAERVNRLPGVASVDVSRSWPSTLQITVTERFPLAFFTGPDGFHLVDPAGLDYKTVPAKPPGLPELALARVAPDDAVTRSVMAVLASLPQELRNEMTLVRAQTPGGVEFTLKNGKVVRWGDAADPDRKLKVLAVLLTRAGRTYDVSSPELPTVS